MKGKLFAFFKRYRLFLLLALLNIGIVCFFPATGKKSLGITLDNSLAVLSVVPPVFILLGLLDVWVKRETMVKFMGEKSGFVGILLAFFIGSAAAGPLYAAFPVAGMLLKKGSSFYNVLIMLGAWSTTKIPLLLFEASSMGIKFTLLRLALDLPGIAAIAFCADRLLSAEEKEEIYRRAEER